jgi:hypothetical protein
MVSLTLLPLSSESSSFPSAILKHENKIFKDINLSLVLYCHETWYLFLGEGPGLRVFQNRVLKRIFGLKKGESNSRLENIT